MLKESYSLYCEDSMKMSKNCVSFLAFCWLLPKDVHKISQTSDRQCICDQCENFRLLRLAFKNNKIHGIKEHTDLCIKQSLCEVTDSNTNDDNSNADGLHQVDRSYGHFRCITRNCKSCTFRNSSE